MKNQIWKARLAAFLCTGLVMSGTAHAATTLVSKGTLPTDGAPANDTSSGGSPSADATKVAFDSNATNLVQNDTNGKRDVFVRDLRTGISTRVSVSNSGVQANGASDIPNLSGDGTKVAFMSEANNLVSGDTNGFRDIFVRDLTTGTTTRVNVSSSGLQSNGISTYPKLSADGTKVTFESEATNLVSDDTNGKLDCFVHDLTTGITKRVSVTSNNRQGNNDSGRPCLNADGTKVAFESIATNFYSVDTKAVRNIFIRDLKTNVTSLVSAGNSSTSGGSAVPANSNTASPSLSSDGTKVAFYSFANNLVSDDTNEFNDIFVRDLTADTTTRVNVSSSGVQSNNDSSVCALSADGTKVAFDSFADNLVNGITNNYDEVFVHDLSTGATIRAAVNINGTQPNQYCALAGLSGDGTKVVFASIADDLVSGDTNRTDDVFVSDVVLPTPTIEINDPRTVNEGSASAPGLVIFTVKLLLTPSQPVTVNYQTADGTAKAGSDYVAKSGTLTFARGENTKFVRVDFIGDSVAEANETFFLNLKTPDNAAIFDSQGSVYIRNDDGPNITIDNAVTIDEGNVGTRPQTFIVHLSEASTRSVRVDWTTANGTAGPADFVAASGTLTFAPGQTSRMIVVQIKGDTQVEPTENYRLNLSSPQYAVLADSHAVGNIRNDDVAQLQFEDDSPSE